MKVDEKLSLLRKEMVRNNIDTYVVPTCDFHGSEVIGEHFKTREFMTGFSGSAGTVVVDMDGAYLWTDGRYFLQAQSQLKGTEVLLMKSGEKGVPTIKEFLKTHSKNIGFDGRMMPSEEAEEYEVLGLNIFPDIDLVGDIWNDRPEISSEKIWILEEQYAGKNTIEKISLIREQMERENADVLLLTALDEVAWTLNLRGNDVKCSPVFMSFMLITKKEVRLYVNHAALDRQVIAYLKKNHVVIKEYHDIYDDVKKIENKVMWVDKSSANFNIIKSIAGSNQIIDKFSPALLQKAIKNKIEITNEKKAHILDGVAMTRFICWLKKNVGKQYLDELILGEKLEEFRTMARSYIEPSFDPIVGYKDHGAIVHYSATEETNYQITDENIVLIDSGGHYLEGTTDITRTISLGDVTDKMKKMYTSVLKGHLNLSAAVFKKGCSGVSLDYIARKPLWDMGMDYNHGTGHGVGYLLNVHEAPNGIRYRVLENPEQNPVLQPGMITSNEPGVYLEGEFGIRIENLILCSEKESSEYGDFLCFENLTLVPYDLELIDWPLLNEDEKMLLTKYHQTVYETLSPYLESEVKDWLKKFIT